MTSTRTLPTSASPDVCTFQIFSDGTQVSDTVHVISLVVTREVNRIPTATLVMLDGEAAAETFALSDQDLFVPGKKIEIKAGYRGQDETLFKGLVVRHSIKVRENGSFLTVECKDEAVKMTIAPRSQYYQNQSDSMVAETLLKRHRMSQKVEDTKFRHPQLVQYHATDWDFMLSRLDQNGLICLVNDGKVTVEKPKTEQKSLVTLQYGATLLELDAEIDTRVQPSELSAQAWDLAAQEMKKAEAREPKANLNGNLAATQLAKVLKAEMQPEPQSGQIPEPVLRELANAKLLKHRLAKIRGRARCQGLALLLPGSLVELKGVGDRFKGPAFVSGVRHQIAHGNWESEVQLGLNPEWFSQTTKPGSQTTPFLGITGLQVGVVTQLEKDPAGQDRIKVRLPVISEKNEGVWARVATLDAGKKRGTFFRPDLQDEVVVGFFNGDPLQAVVLGMCHSSAKPAPIAASNLNHEKGFFSRSNMKILFHDEDKTLTIRTPKGNQLHLSEKDQRITLQDQHGNKVVLDKNGIALSSIKDITLKAVGNVKLEGINIAAKASSSFKAEGGSGNVLSAGNGMAIVKGGTVMIN
ncbi:type VI secretion system tip protein VgrG [Rufibacter hautae]|uniref:Type VI secretion system tip protein VgrG n=1 Tax=Rufibacter hautae TaxID=2595005 RepID=A0A5B6THM3_9BACT|nr:type VI secretion system tip protein VgrG [Rufibacter hautae]KAA3438754.1 type VI secretion system tip protein VgrG [Rufibacter hautae]